MFKYIQIAPVDPILGLSEIYNNDTRKNKVNLSIGVYKNKTGNTPIFNSVKQAEELLLKTQKTKNYLNIEGLHDFNKATQELLFGKNNTIIPKKNICTVQAPGGTGALRIASDFLLKNTRSKRIWIGTPGWPNHKNIFIASGFEICTYQYYNFITNTLNFDELFSSLKTANSGDIVLFHGCCHNPTGVGPNIDQWNILAELCQKNNLIPLFDIAYQGFDKNLEKDLLGLHIFCKKNENLIVCNSYSKNFGLYNERIGACTVITNDNNISDRILGQLRLIIRSNYSNPPAHGALIVSTILNNKKLFHAWKTELQDIREKISHTRKLFVNILHENNNTEKDFSFITKQTGMFAFLGLQKNKVLELREKFGIYLVNLGRINLASLSEKNLSNVCSAIKKIF